MALYAVAAPVQSPRAGAQGRSLLSAKQPRDVHCVRDSVYPILCVNAHDSVRMAMFVRRFVSAHL